MSFRRRTRRSARPRVAKQCRGRVVEDRKIRSDRIDQRAPGSAKARQGRGVQEPKPHERFGKPDSRRQAGDLPREYRRLEHLEGFVAQYRFDVRKVPQREDRLVPPALEFARKGYESHQVAVVAAEFPSKKDARHRMMLTRHVFGSFGSADRCERQLPMSRNFTIRAEALSEPARGPRFNLINSWS